GRVTRVRPSAAIVAAIICRLHTNARSGLAAQAKKGTLNFTPKSRRRSILGAVADEALRPELQGNEEARRLMQETLLDEAAFAAADAAERAANTNTSGSPPLNVPSTKDEKGDPLIGPVHHKQWQCIEKAAFQPASRVAIYVNRRFLDNFQIFPDFSPTLDPNVLPITLKHNVIKSCSFSVINVYNPPKTRNSAIGSLLDTLSRLPNIMIIQGDFNLPSGIWDPGRNTSSPMSIELFNRLSDEGFGLCNDEGAPTWTNRSFGTTEHWGRPYIPSGEEEEDHFVQDLSDSIRRRTGTLNTHGVEEVVAAIGQDIQNSWDRNSKTPRVGAGSTTWWTAECQRAKDLFLASRTRENQKLYDIATKKARSDFFGRKIDLMSANDSPWEGVRWTKPRPPPKYSTITQDGRPIEDVETLFNTMHAHFSTSPAAEQISWEAIDGIPQLPMRSFPAISQKEIWDALRPTTNSSAPGPDHVTWRHLKLALSLPETDVS
ncbi:hypothetical protein AX14_006399, partial [Amanita brunnescens Koide BX004]